MDYAKQLDDDSTEPSDEQDKYSDQFVFPSKNTEKIKDYIEDILGEEYAWTYESPDKDESLDDAKSLEEVGSSDEAKSLEEVGSSDKAKSWDAFLESIFKKTKDDCDIMKKAKETEAPLGAIVVGSVLCSKSKDLAKTRENAMLEERYRKRVETFSGIAKNMINERYERDPDNAYKSLIVELPFNNGYKTTVLSLLSDQGASSIFDTTCCRQFVSGMWRSKKGETGTKKENNNTAETMKQLFNGTFYTPKIKFWIDFFFHLSFMITLSLFITSILAPFTSIREITVFEWIIYFYIAGKFVEEIEQFVRDPSDLIDSGAGKRLHRLRMDFVNYINQAAWNTLDLFILLTFVVVIACRFTVAETDFQVVRFLFCVPTFLSFIRFLRYLCVFDSIGPRVLGLTMLFHELAKFGIILFVIVSGFGVAFQALLNPQQPPSIHTLGDIFYRPFWQMLGELLLDDADTGMGLEVGNYSCSYMREQGRTDLNCHPYLTLVLLGLYLFVSHVVLLNLLIAIFGEALSTVKDQSKIRWAFTYCMITREYYYKSVVPPPFTLIMIPYKIWYHSTLNVSWMGFCQSKNPDDNFYKKEEECFRALDDKRKNLVKMAIEYLKEHLQDKTCASSENLE